jgi:hypothetical protein
MPCYDSRTEEDAKIMQRRLDEATRAACELAQVLQSSLSAKGFVGLVSAETFGWVRAHERADVKRRADAKG